MAGFSMPLNAGAQWGLTTGSLAPAEFAGTQLGIEATGNGFSVASAYTPSTQFGGGNNTGGGGGIAGGISLGTAIGQMIGSVVTARGAARLSADVLKTQAHINENNAKIAQMGYESAMRAGDSEIQRITMSAGSLKSKQKAAMAANGIRLGVGSAADVTASTDVMKELDMHTARSNAIGAAFGYSTKASNYRSTAAAQQTVAAYNGSDGATGMTIGAALEGVGTVADRWYKYFGEGY